MLTGLVIGALGVLCLFLLLIVMSLCANQASLSERLGALEESAVRDRQQQDRLNQDLIRAVVLPPNPSRPRPS